MRSSSGNKKKPEFQKYMESRVLITSNSIHPHSRNITSKLDLIKQQISRQFHQKFLTDKKRTTPTKKNNSRSKSKFQQSKPLDNVIRKINFNHQDITYAGRSSAHITTQNHSETDNFRQKFYDLQDKFLSQRQKMIDNFEKMNLLKQSIIQFLEDPSLKTAQNLQQNFTSQRHQKLIQKFISMNEDIQFAETTLKQILSIVEVDDIETLIAQLKNRQIGSKNLGECSYKILEMQAAYNKLQQQSQDKLKQIQKEASLKQKQLRDELQNQVKQIKISIQNARKQQERKCKKIINKMFLQMKKPIYDSIAKDSAMELMSSVNHDQSRIMFATFDKNPLKKQRGDSELVIQTKKIPFYPVDAEDYTVEQLLQSIMQLFKQMEDNLIQIQKEAEQNHEKLMLSKLDFDRMEKMIENLTQQSNQQKNKLIQHFQDILNQKQRHFSQEEERLKLALKQKQEEYHRIQEQLRSCKAKINDSNNKSEQWKRQKNQAHQKLKGKQKIINKIINIICDATGEETQLFGIEQNINQTNLNSQNSLGQIIISKIQVVLKKHLLSLKQNLQAAQNLILWHEKQLQIKQGLLRQFDFNLKKLIEQSEIGQENEKKTSFERDEYKYLLGNLRQNVREMKKDYQQRIVQVKKQKDQQYLNSNKDILRDNQRLNNQVQKLQKGILSLTDQVKAEAASHKFYRQKSMQFDISLIDLRKKLINAQTEAVKYKQCLADIETSFKQVENMSEKTSQKMIGLEEQKKLITSEVNELRSKSQSLMAQIQVKDENFNKLQYGYEQLKKKFEKISKIKQDLQLQNSNLRIKNLQIIEQTRAKAQQSKKIVYENSIISKQNKKLMQQINYVTKKLINYVNDKQQTKNSKQEIRQIVQSHIKNQFQKIKKQYTNFKILTRDYLQQYRTLFEEETEQINKQLSQHFKFTQRQKQAKKIVPQNIDENEKIKLKRQVKLKENIVQLKQEINSIKQYCKYVKSQFRYQLKVVKEMLKEPETYMRQQQQKISNELNSILKVHLLINSLRNQNEELKQIVQKGNQIAKEIIRQYQIKMNQLLVEINEANKQSAINKENNINQDNQANQSIDGNQSFNRYFKSRQEKKEEFLEIKSPQTLKSVQHQYKSPQFLKLRKDTLTQQEQQSLVDKRQNQQKMFILRPALSQKEDDKLRNSNAPSIVSSQAQRVIRILNSLKELDSDDPKISYFEQIKGQYSELKKKLIGKNLNLDLSAVSFRPNTLSSPISLGSKEFLQERRFNTDPNEDQLFPKQSNRSEHRNDRSLAGARKQNNLLNSRLERLEQQLKQFQAKEDEYKIQISQLERQVVQLQNQSSSKMKQNVFKSFITQIFSQNWQKAKSNCRTILKLFKLQKIEIDQFMDKFQQFLSHQNQKDRNKNKQKNKEKDKTKQKLVQKQSEMQQEPKITRQKQVKAKKEQDLDNLNDQKDKKRTNNSFFSGLFNNAKN